METTISEIRHKQLIKLIKAIEDRVARYEVLNKDILDSKEACTYLNISDSMLYKLTSENKIPYFKPNGKKLYFKKVDLDKWTLKNRVESNDSLEDIADEIYREQFKNNGHDR